MKGNVNPFEPWRPVEDRIPQPIHASRPWRPPPPPPVRPVAEEPPFVEPVNPLPRNKLPERQAPPKRLPCTKGLPRAARTPMTHWTAFVVLFLLAVICLDNVGWLRAAHLPRLLALGASAGMFAGLALNLRRSWYTRLSWMAASLAFAGIAAWFVPTVHGVSLWSAYRQVEQLRSLPAGDIAEYQRREPARRVVWEEYPSFDSDIRAAEHAWLRRTVDEAIETSDRQLERDPQKAFAHLHRLNTELAPLLKQYISVQKELESARLRAMQASAKVVQREVNKEQIGNR